MRLCIRNAWIYGEDFQFHKGSVHVTGEQISGFDLPVVEGERIVEGEGCYVIPGLADIHFHGCMGMDFSDAAYENLEKIVTYERMNGITTICPTTMTLPIEQLERIAYLVREYEEKNPEVLAGMNLEGPFLSKDKCGVQAPEYCCAPDVSVFNRLWEMSGGAIRLITVAPELKEAMPFIEEAAKKTVVALGHSAADYHTATEAFFHGASHVTHLYNGMNVWNHREPGISGAAFDQEAITVELICDGNHLHPSVIRSAWRQYGDDKIVLVSDSTMATGLPDGVYTLGGQNVVSKNKRVTALTEPGGGEGVLAGSASNLMDCVQYLVKKVGLPLESVVKCATLNPTKIIQRSKKYGSLGVGKYANIVVLDRNLELRNVIYRGNILL